jgi:lysozyme
MKHLLLFAIFAASPFIGSTLHKTWHANDMIQEPAPMEYDRVTIPVEQIEEYIEEPAPVCEEPQPAELLADAKLMAKELIMKHEGFRSAVYRCPAGYRTIGYGFTDAKYLRLNRLTEAQAQHILEHEIIPETQKLLSKYVKVPLDPYQEAALISFTFNVGEEGLARIVSERRNRLNAGNYEVIPSVLKLYTKAKVKGKPVTLAGLVKRRNEEAKLFSGASF